MKEKLIVIAVRFIMGAVALGIGIWYLSSSIGGAALTYTSMGNFMTAIGASDGDVANVNGCFMCGYISELFNVIGDAAKMFWDAIIDYLWILMAIGFGIYLFVHSAQHLMNAAKTTAKLDTSEKKLELMSWIDPVWKLAVRITIVGLILGTIGMGGDGALRTLADVIITPVLYIGGQLSMIASGVSDGATCNALVTGTSGGVLNPIYAPFMCVIGNINSIMLAGAAGGFSLMNYAWMGLGGGVLTWVTGLALVITFLVIGFDLFFQILSVIFKLVFLIIFMPLLVAAYAFEGTWSLAKNVAGGAINMLVNSAISIVRITLKVLITYAIIAYAADMYMPGPVDNYSAVFPPMMGRVVENPDAQTMSVINVFAECERVSLVNGTVDGDIFKTCFMAKKSAVESVYPGAFDFMDSGLDFLLLMFGLFLLYFYAIAPRVDKIIGGVGSEKFDIGGDILKLGKSIWKLPVDITEKVTSYLKEKSS